LRLAGCASTQFGYNTLDIAASVSALYTRQALYNLSQYIDDPFALPSQTDIQQGTVQTTNSVTPSITFPFSGTVLNSVTGVDATITRAKSFSTAGAGGSLNAVDSWQQNWSVLPLSDANTLRNLRALYRHVIYDTDLRREYQVSRIARKDSFPIDPYYLLEPQCVLCTEKLTPNPKLHSNWIYWTSDSLTSTNRMPPDNVPIIGLGHFGSHELYMTQEDYYRGYLAHFVLFILPAAVPGATRRDRSAWPRGRRTR
jgi:hypothetical protein